MTHRSDPSLIPPNHLLTITTTFTSCNRSNKCNKFSPAPPSPSSSRNAVYFNCII